MLSVSPDRPVEPLTLQLLQAVASVAAELQLSWFVAGAAARDILLEGVFALDSGRQTKDVDLAVAMATWKKFAEMKRRLLQTGEFVEVAGVPHRLRCRHGRSKHGYPMDLIPFGGVEDDDQMIAWPPDLTEIMNVAGYEEARSAAVEVEVRPGFVVPVASLPGLAVLKIFAWADRGHVDPRDAIDLLTLCRRYADAGNADRLYGPELTMLEHLDYKMELAGPRLLGRDVRDIVSMPTAQKMQAILDDRGDRLVTDMARASHGADGSIGEGERLLEQFMHGFRRE